MFRCRCMPFDANEVARANNFMPLMYVRTNFPRTKLCDAPNLRNSSMHEHT